MNEPVISAPLVLIVEDDADARDMYEVVLGTSGFSVASAADGVEAIAKARALRPRLILMDLSLPSMDGWEASRQLKGEAATREIPIVALSGIPIDAEAGAGRTFASALLKPCLPDDLVAEVRRLIGSLHS
jgi:two-component system cell cycle response regulator DivK